jgi:hypothetical protein
MAPSIETISGDDIGQLMQVQALMGQDLADA